MRRVLFLVLVVTAAAGCTGGSKHSAPQPTTPPTQLNAEYICRHYVTGHLVSSETTTVGDFRKTTIGPPAQGPQFHRFPKLLDSTAAASCWTGKPGAYSVDEVASDGEVEQVVSNMNGVALADAHGAPQIP